MTFQIRNPHSKAFLQARYRRPTLDDANRILGLARTFPRSELDATYLYLLLSDHFATTSMIAEMEGYLVGVAIGHRKPLCDDTLSVWQVGTVPPVQGKGIGTTMLLELIARPENADVRFIETAAFPDDRATRRLFARLAHMTQAPLDDVRAIVPRRFIAGRGRGSLLRLGPIPARTSA